MARVLRAPPNLAWQKLDGTPNAGGFLLFCEPGTHAAKNVFNKEGASLGDLIQLDDTGRPEGGPLYYEGVYDIEVQELVDDNNFATKIYIQGFGEEAARDGKDGENGLRGIPGVVPDTPTVALVEEIKKGLSPGIEFIFTITAATADGQDAVDPSLPDNNWEYDEPQSPWSDGAPEATPSLPYLWQSIRRQVNGEWLQWSAPAKISKLGIDGVDGDNAIDGEGFEAIFISTADTELPDEPDGRWEFDNPQAPWHDVHPGINQALPYTWTSTRRKVLGIWQAWSPARIISQFSSSGVNGVNGTDGTDGEDAFGIEFIFATTEDANPPSDPMRAWSYRSPGEPWHRDPQEISETDIYHWVSTRHTKGQAAIPGDDGDWTTPVIFNRWVEDGRDGADAIGEAGRDGTDGLDGADGIGLEIIYAASNNDEIAVAERPSNGWGYQSPGTVAGIDWTTHPPASLDGVTRLFSSQRETVGNPDPDSAIDGEWSTPALISNPRVFPSGAVIMWHGAFEDIPDGWRLCDGTNGTPDMTGMMPRGIAEGNSGGSGGSSTSGGTAITVEQMPEHTHDIDIHQDSTPDNAFRLVQANINQPVRITVETESTGGGQEHTHTIDPPYVSLFFIMKVDG